MAHVDVSTEPKRAYRSIIPKLRKGQKPATEALPKPKPVRHELQGISVDITPGPDGLTVKAKGKNLGRTANTVLAAGLVRLLIRHNNK